MNVYTHLYYATLVLATALITIGAFYNSPLLSGIAFPLLLLAIPFGVASDINKTGENS